MRRLRTIEALEERRLMWANSLEHNGIAYRMDASDSTAAIFRYDLENEAWLAKLNITVPGGTLNWITISSDGIFVAYGSRVDQYDLDGRNRVELVAAAAKPVERVFVDEIDDSLLIMTHAGGSISTLDFATGVVAYSNQSASNWNTILVHDAAHNRLFGAGTTNGQTLGTSYAADGLLQGATVYTAGIYSSYTPVIWLSPEGDRLFTNSTVVNDVETGAPAGRLETGIDRLGFIGSSPVVVYNDEATLYGSDTLLPVGKIELHPHTVALFGRDDKLVAFVPGPDGYDVREYALDSFTAPQPVLDPQRLAFLPDAIVPASDGSLLLLSRRNGSLFRWDSAAQTYLSTIDLYDEPAHLTYSESLNIAFLAYKSGLVSRIDLSAAEPREQMLGMLGYDTRILAADDLLLAFPASGAYENYLAAYDAALNLVERKIQSSTLSKATWNSENQAVYHTSNGLSSLPVDVETNPASPLSNINSVTYATNPGSTSYSAPLRVSPDGSLLITGSGHILDARTLVRESRMLPHTVTDLAWLGSQLYTVRRSTYGTEIKRWNAMLDKEEAVLLRPGEPLALYAVAADRLVAVTRDAAGIPRFTLLDENLAVIQPTEAFSVVETGAGTAVNEDGLTDTVEVFLMRPPTSDVVLKVASYDSHLAASPALLTFTPENWHVPQVVQVSAVDDWTTDLSTTGFLVISVDEPSSDAAFHGAGSATLNVTVDDNDTTVLTKIEHAGIRYTFAANHNRVTRFDVTTQTWLSTIALAGATGNPSNAVVNDDGIFVSSGKTLHRYNLDGTGRALAWEGPASIYSLVNDDNLLIFNYYSDPSPKRITSYDTALGQVVTANFTATFEGGLMIDRTTRRVIGRSSSKELGSVGYDAAGNLFDYVRVTANRRAYLFPQGGRLIDASGYIRSTTTLEALGRLQPPGVDFEHISFLPDGSFVILRFGSPELYDTSFTRIATLHIHVWPNALRSDSQNMYLDYYESSAPGGVRTEVIPFSQLEPTGQLPPSQAQTAYTPKEVIGTAGRFVLLNDRLHATVRRWDTNTQLYAAPIQLGAVAEAIAYSANSNTLYLGYATGQITRIDLNAEQPVEVPFADAGAPINGLAMAGNFLFAVTSTSRMTYAATGEQIDNLNVGGDAGEYTWVAASQRVYEQDQLKNIPRWTHINADGSIAGEPPGGIVTFWPERVEGGSMTYGRPVRISPDGNTLLHGLGEFHDALGFSRQPQKLSNTINDATWLNGDLFTLRNVEGGAELQRWAGGTYQLERSLPLGGSAVSLTALPDGRLLVITQDIFGVPSLRLFDAEFVEIAPPQGLVIEQTDGQTTVTETGAGDTIRVSLGAPPIGELVVTVTSSDTRQVSVSPTSLVFTPANWNSPQSVTVKGVRDGYTDEDQTVFIKFSAPALGLAPREVAVAALENAAVSLPPVTGGGIVYFASRLAPRVERLNLSTGERLTPLQLDAGFGVATAATATDTHLYVAYGTSLLRFNLAGGEREVVLNMNGKISELFVDGQLVLIESFGGVITGYNLATGTRVISKSSGFDLRHVDTVHKRVIGSDSSSTYLLRYDESGRFSASTQVADSKLVATWLIGEGERMLDSNGNLFDLEDPLKLSFAPAGITDVAQTEGQMLLLRGNKLTTYEGLIQLETITLDHSPAKLLLNSAHLITLTADSNAPSGYVVRLLSRSMLNLPSPGTKLNPDLAQFVPDDVELTSDGNLLLLSKVHRAVFRWNTTSQIFEPSIPLSGLADAIVYFAPTNSLFVSYASQALVRIDLDDPALVEHSVATLLKRTNALGVAGDYLLVSPGLHTYRTDGTRVDTSSNDPTLSTTIWLTRRGEFVWHESLQRMLYAVGPQLYATQINASGSAYPTEVPGGIGSMQVASGSSALGYVRISPDGTQALTGAGTIFNLTGGTMAAMPSTLPVSVSGAWLGSRPYTLVDNSGGTSASLRRESDPPVYSTLIAGKAHSVHALPGDRLLVITIRTDGRPSLRIYDGDLKSIAAPPATIVGRQLFYNNSKFDRNAPGVDGDDLAIATDKLAYLPGAGVATFNSVSSYARGINGLMIDIAGAHGPLSPADFVFTLGAGGDPNGWLAAPVPSGFTVRWGAGVGGSDRVEIVWPDGAVRDTWLQVRIKANATTRLVGAFPDESGGDSLGDVFYFGSKLGDTGVGNESAFVTSAADELFIRNHTGSRIQRPIWDPSDHNRDGTISAGDILVSRMAISTGALEKLNLPGPESTEEASLPAAFPMAAAAHDQVRIAMSPASPARGRNGADYARVAGALAFFQRQEQTSELERALSPLLSFIAGELTPAAILRETNGICTLAIRAGEKALAQLDLTNLAADAWQLDDGIGEKAKPFDFSSALVELPT